MNIQRCRRYFVRVQICLYRLWCPHRSCQDAPPAACNRRTNARPPLPEQSPRFHGTLAPPPTCARPAASTNATFPQASEGEGVGGPVDNSNTAATDNGEHFELPFWPADLPDCTCHGLGGGRSYRSLMSSQSSLLPSEEEDASSACASDSTCEDTENDNMPTSDEAAQIRAFIDLLDAGPRTLDAPLQPGYRMIRIPRMRSFPPDMSADYARTHRPNTEREARAAGLGIVRLGGEWHGFRSSQTAAALRSTNMSRRSGYPPSDGTDDRATLDENGRTPSEQPRHDGDFLGAERAESTMDHTDGRLWSSRSPARCSYPPSMSHVERAPPEANMQAVADQRDNDECDTSREGTGSCCLDRSIMSQNMCASL